MSFRYFCSRVVLALLLIAFLLKLWAFWAQTIRCSCIPTLRSVFYASPVLASTVALSWAGFFFVLFYLRLTIPGKRCFFTLLPALPTLSLFCPLLRVFDPCQTAGCTTREKRQLYWGKKKKKKLYDCAGNSSTLYFAGRAVVHFTTLLHSKAVGRIGTLVEVYWHCSSDACLSRKGHSFAFFLSLLLPLVTRILQGFLKWRRAVIFVHKRKKKKFLPTVTLNGRNVSRIGSGGKAIWTLAKNKLPFQVRIGLYLLLVSMLQFSYQESEDLEDLARQMCCISPVTWPFLWTEKT